MEPSDDILNSSLNSTLENSASTEPDSLPLETPKSQKSNIKPLIIILSILSIVIIALVIIVIVVANQNNQPTSAPIAEDDTAAIDGTSTDAKALAAAGWTNPEQLAENNIKKQELAEISARALVMLNESSSNLDNVYELYKNYFNEALNVRSASDDTDNEAISYFSSLTNLLITNNMKKEALDAYDVFSLDKLSELNQFGLYSNAADLARELNDTEKANYYQQKANYYYPVWEEQVRKTEEIDDNFDAYIEQNQSANTMEEE